MEDKFPAPTEAKDSLIECALQVLRCPDPWMKAEYTFASVKMWREGVIKRVRPANWRHLRVPDRPARSDDKVECARIVTAHYPMDAMFKLQVAALLAALCL